MKKRRFRAINKRCEECGTTGLWFQREIKCDICGGKLKVIDKSLLRKLL
jgi:rRNA maturation endonuclease Nob1